MQHHERQSPYTTRRLNVPAPQHHGHQTPVVHPERPEPNFSLFERAMLLITCILVSLAVVAFFVILYKVNIAVNDAQEYLDKLRNNPLFGG